LVVLYGQFMMHGQRNIKSWWQSVLHSSILCHQGTLLSRLSGYNLKMA